MLKTSSGIRELIETWGLAGVTHKGGVCLAWSSESIKTKILTTVRGSLAYNNHSLCLDLLTHSCFKRVDYESQGKSSRFRSIIEVTGETFRSRRLEYTK